MAEEAMIQVGVVTALHQKEWTVQTEQSEATGKWSCKCPLCPARVEAMTQFGLQGRLCDHMNYEHPFAARGNA